MKAGLYVHVPFCSSVCPYCDFAVTLAGEERRAEWERALLDEAAMYAECGFQFHTVYFGGGTPSALKIDRLARVKDGLSEKVQIDPDAQVFIEVNPEDVTPETARAWLDLGFSSVSVGVQALNDVSLGILGRCHTAEQARRSIETLLDSGFQSVSLDLIFGLPGQARSVWEGQLREAAGLGVQHLSCYQLTFHEGTVFGKRREAGLMTELGEAPQADLYGTTHEVLGATGFEGYEVSNFALPGHRSVHNLKYWTGAPYLGLGPGAHSFNGVNKRWWNRRKVRLWQREIDQGRRPVEGKELLTAKQRALETLMLGMRTADGVDLAWLEKRFQAGVITPNAGTLRDLEAKGLISRQADRIAPTPAGMAVADALARALRIEGAEPEPEPVPVPVIVPDVRG
ncbi:MAG: radical SAM family heme chaperone HemW [Acidobacteriota bacterium]